MKKFAFLGVAFLATACATRPPVAAVDLPLMTALAGEASVYFADQLPVAATPVHIVSAGQVELDQALSDALHRRGFAVSESTGSGTRQLTARQLPVTGGEVLLQLSIDGTTATRRYQRRSGGGVVATSLYTVLSPASKPAQTGARSTSTTPVPKKSK